MKAAGFGLSLFYGTHGMVTVQSWLPEGCSRYHTRAKVRQRTVVAPAVRTASEAANNVAPVV